MTTERQTSDPVYHPQPDVLFTELAPTEAVLLSLRGACYFALNETGSRIWQEVEKGVTLTQIAHALENEYDVGPCKALEYTRAFIHQLIREDLVRVDQWADP
jgi:hypothetical protein